MEVLAHYFCGEKPLNEYEKTGSKVSKNLVLKTMTKPPFIEARKIWPLGSVSTAGRPGRSTANGQNPTVGASGRPTRSTEQLEERVNSLSVDRPGRPRFPESKALWSGRPSRSTVLQCTQACTSVHVRSTGPVDRTSLSGQFWVCTVKGLGNRSFNLIKIP